ncbi:MAG TPA: chromosomal protein MC1 [Candidatus Omnitrophica bacterium]|nr:chromosomal protein MC1 [Candidatus Omnitrophota bacterium]
MAEVKQYSLRVGGSEDHVFTGRSPRAAALKAASRGLKDSDGLIKLREHGRKKDGKWRVHVFDGKVEKVAKPANAPDWMPDMINKPTVKKLRVEKLDKI